MKLDYSIKSRLIHIIEVLLKDGYIINGKEHSKIKLSNEGYKRLESVIE
jgi:hypothetical protein